MKTIRTLKTNRTTNPGSQLAPLDRYIALRQILEWIWQEAVKCPRKVLETASPRISLRQLRYCAYYAPHIAYKIRFNLSDKQRAVILGYTIEMAGLVFDDDEMKDYMDEITDSMIAFPNVWKVTFGHDWRRLCLSIQFLLGIDLGLSEDDLPPIVPDRPPEPKRAIIYLQLF